MAGGCARRRRDLAHQAGEPAGDQHAHDQQDEGLDGGKAVGFEERAGLRQLELGLLRTHYLPNPLRRVFFCLYP